MAAKDEQLSVTLHNTIVVLWLERLHSGLPQLVKRRFATELREHTLATIKPQILQRMNCLLHELKMSQKDYPLLMQLHRKSVAPAATGPGMYTRRKAHLHFHNTSRAELSLRDGLLSQDPISLL